MKFWAPSLRLLTCNVLCSNEPKKIFSTSYAISYRNIYIHIKFYIFLTLSNSECAIQFTEPHKLGSSEFNEMVDYRRVEIEGTSNRIV